jgi:hypothetical protein
MNSDYLSSEPEQVIIGDVGALDLSFGVFE